MKDCKYKLKDGKYKLKDGTKLTIKDSKIETVHEKEEDAKSMGGVCTLMVAEASEHSTVSSAGLQTAFEELAW